MGEKTHFSTGCNKAKNNLQGMCLGQNLKGK